MLRKISCFIILVFISVFLFACSQSTVTKAGGDILSDTPTTTESTVSSSVPLETPTNTANEAAGSIPSAIPTAEGYETRPPYVPTKIVQKVTGEIPSKIPTNPTVGYAWGGCMCEAGGLVYYVSDDGKGADSLEYVARISPNGGKDSAVTGKYKNITWLTADDKNLYFVASTSGNETDDVLYALPVSGGGERKVCDWKNGCPQAAGGRLYWEQNIDLMSKDNVTSIMSMNTDGTDVRELLSIKSNYWNLFYFLATPNGLYYMSQGSDSHDCNLYYMDLQGQNKVQLNKQKLGEIDRILYDQNNLYFTTLFDKAGLFATVNRLDENGQKVVIIKKIGYNTDDAGPDFFYGVSDNIFYYFSSGDYTGSKFAMDLHSYDMNNEKDKKIATVKMDMDELHWNESVLQSIRGKTINVQSSTGFYILGNDLYYSFWTIP